ncbi:MAG TPA: R3H domain-containing nucleic acid-binding protein [Candidatus Peribacteraceae bacterium]|nr:R3H domain-containing nucleic acid-binding protein [Candidatus Peribacteraceae bacterium]
MDSAYIQTALADLLDHLHLQHGGVTVRQEGDVTRVDIESNEASRIIGWHGETLNSVQHVLKSMVRTKEKLERTPLIIVDVDGYRSMQEEKVKKIAEQKADFVRRTGNRIALSPMSPYFRRIIHLHIANNPELQDLTTESVGEGDYRQIVLRLKDEKKGSKIKGGEELAPVIEADDGLENLDI